MFKYCAKKIAQLLIVLVLISFFSFGIIYLAPGDVSSMYITSDMTDEQKEQVIEDLGLNQSMTEQYFAWAKRAMHGDLGVSQANRSAVAPQILKRLPATIQLMGASLILSLFLAIPLGLIAGMRKNTWIDNLISSISYVGMSVPSFWMGMLLIILFTAKLHILPSSGMHSAGNTTILDTIKHMIMPCITLSLGNLAVFIRYVRANAVGQLSEEYVVTAMAKGTSDMKILFQHVMKNTLLPIITLLGMNMASLVCGSFIVETIFGWPGIGTLAMSAIGSRDYPMIMAYIMMSGCILVVGNFVADILYAVVDPRIKRGIDSANGK